MNGGLIWAHSGLMSRTCRTYLSGNVCRCALKEHHVGPIMCRMNAVYASNAVSAIIQSSALRLVGHPACKQAKISQWNGYDLFAYASPCNERSLRPYPVAETMPIMTRMAPPSA